MRLVSKKKFMVICSELRSTGNTGEVPKFWCIKECEVPVCIVRHKRLKSTYHRFSFLVKLLYLDLRGKNLGITRSANKARFRMMNARPCGSQQIASWFLSSPRTDINRWGKMCWQSPSPLSSSSSMPLTGSSLTFSHCPLSLIFGSILSPTDMIQLVKLVVAISICCFSSCCRCANYVFLPVIMVGLPVAVRNPWVADGPANGGTRGYLSVRCTSVVSI